MKITQAGYSMPKEAFNGRLAEAIQELNERPGITDARARIMVGGSYMDDPWFIDIIESTGAVVVTDFLCSGRKYVEGMVDETIEPIEAIARAVLPARTPPARAWWTATRNVSHSPEARTGGEGGRRDLRTHHLLRQPHRREPDGGRGRRGTGHPDLEPRERVSRRRPRDA